MTAPKLFHNAFQCILGRKTEKAQTYLFSPQHNINYLVALFSAVCRIPGALAPAAARTDAVDGGTLGNQKVTDGKAIQFFINSLCQNIQLFIKIQTSAVLLPSMAQPVRIQFGAARFLPCSSLCELVQQQRQSICAVLLFKEIDQNFKTIQICQRLWPPNRNNPVENTLIKFRQFFQNFPNVFPDINPVALIAEPAAVQCPIQSCKSDIVFLRLIASRRIHQLLKPPFYLVREPFQREFFQAWLLFVLFPENQQKQISCHTDAGK